MSEQQHAILPPSFAHVWGYCSGAISAKMGAPERYTPDTEEGTAAHWVGSECLSMWCEPDGGAPPASFWIGETAPNGVVIDDDITDAVQVYVDDVLEVCQKHGGLSKLLIEHRVHMPQIHDENWGTLDTCLPLLLPTQGTALIYLWDYKHGHRENRAAGNLQLIDYIAGIVAELNINGFDDQNITVVLRVVQPRCYHAAGPISEWRAPLSDLRGYFNQLQAQGHEALTNPTMTTGLHCRDCPGVGRCAARRMADYSLIDYVRQPYQIDAMTGAELGLERDMLDAGIRAATARLDAIDDDLRHRIAAGATDTGKALQSKEGRQAWNIPDEQVIVMARQFGVDARKPVLLTPPQLIKKAPAALKSALTQAVDSMSSRPAGALQIINAEDSLSSRAFGKKEVTP